MAHDPFIQIWICPDLDGLRTIEVREGVGAWQVFTIDQAYIFDDALQYWEDAANASGALANTYDFRRSEANETVTFSADAAFDIRLRHSLYEACGFAAMENTGAATYVSTLQPTVFWNIDAGDYDAPRPVEEVDLLELRHGRVLAMAFRHSRMSKIRIVQDTETTEAMLESPILGGKIRFASSTDRAAAYSLSNLDGYIDGYCAGIEDLETLGRDEQLTSLRLAISHEEA